MKWITGIYSTKNMRKVFAIQVEGNREHILLYSQKLDAQTKAFK
jgi:hypothetical protein